jgi:hypothetical protein
MAMGDVSYYATANHEAASKFIGQRCFAVKHSAGGPAAPRGLAQNNLMDFLWPIRFNAAAACLSRAKPMKKLVFAILLIASPALAQTKLLPKGVTARVDNCAPIGRTEDGKLVYSMKCEHMPAPPPPPPQAEAKEAPAPALEPEPEVHRSGIFGLSYERKRPDE